MNDKPEKIPFDKVIEQLLNEESMLPVNLTFRLSDLSTEEAAALKNAWPQISSERRLGLLQDMETIMEGNLIVNFDEIARIGLVDPVAEIRETALRCLWESEDPAFVSLLLEMINIEENIRVKAQIIHSLGKFIYLGETGQLIPSKFDRIMQTVEGIYLSDQPEPLRQSALEALSHSSHEKIDQWVEDAIDAQDENWLRSALHSIGNIGDEKWEEVILENLDHEESIIQLEAVRAAGEMGSENAKEMLIDLLEDDNEDVRMAAVWSLSEIGGYGVKDVLEALRDELDSDDELDFLEDAIENFLFQADLKEFDLMDIIPEDVDSDEDKNHIN